jgi:hypothetical protein
LKFPINSFSLIGISKSGANLVKNVIPSGSCLPRTPFHKNRDEDTQDQGKLAILNRLNKTLMFHNLLDRLFEQNKKRIGND